METDIMKQTVLLLSGTSEGPILAQALLDAGFDVLATVTRAEARVHLFGGLLQAIRVETRGFTEESLQAFLTQGGAALVLDATHPYAVRITQIAASVCARLGVPYVRYQRPDWEPPAETTVYAAGYAEAAALLPELGSRILLTLGAKQLKHFAHLHDRLTQFARVLPSPASVQQALDAGFAQGRILALRPPFSQAFNMSLLREYAIEVLVTKASGAAGGVVEKVLAAHEMGLTTLMIHRPVQPELAVVSSVEAAVQACQAYPQTGVADHVIP
jgi:precorrin-6A/cobalt-precorrin-6A reductase